MTTMYGILMALLSSCSWASCAVLFKNLGKKYTPIDINLFNVVSSFIWLCLLVVLTHSNILIQKGDIITIAISAFLGIVIADSIYYSALYILSPVALTIISILGSIFSGMWGYFLYGEVLDTISVAGILFVFIGVGFISSTYPKSKRLVKLKIYGILLAILSSCLTSFSVAILKPVLIRNSSLVVIMYRMLFSSVIILLYTLFSKKFNIFIQTFCEENKYKTQIIITSFLYVMGGLYCSMLAIKSCNLAIVSSIMAIQPFFVLLVMILFFKYKPKLSEYISIGFIVIGLLLFCID